MLSVKPVSLYEVAVVLLVSEDYFHQCLTISSSWRRPKRRPKKKTIWLSEIASANINRGIRRPPFRLVFVDTSRIALSTLKGRGGIASRVVTPGFNRGGQTAFCHFDFNAKIIAQVNVIWTDRDHWMRTGMLEAVARRS